MTPRLSRHYVQPDMVYAGGDCSQEEAVQRLDALMQEDMRQRLLAQEDQQAWVMPSFVFSCLWPDGGATLNVFCTQDGWSYVWDVELRRLPWLPLFTKGYATGLSAADTGKLRSDIAWICAAQASDVPVYLKQNP